MLKSGNSLQNDEVLKETDRWTFFVELHVQQTFNNNEVLPQA